MTLVCNPAVNSISNGAYNTSFTEQQLTGTASLSWKPNTDNLLYFTYSRGYKAGGWNMDRSDFAVFPWTPVQPSITDLKFRPELVDSFEVGWKWTLFGGTTTINTDIFDEQIKDFQENAFSGFDFVTFNVPKTVSRGVEVDYNTQLTKGLTLQGGVTYLEAFFNSDLPSLGLAKGTPFSDAPKWAITSALTYNGKVNDKLVWLASVDGRWNSSYRLQTLSRNPITDNQAYSIFDARLGLGADTSKWMLEAWVRNLANTFYGVGAFAVPEQTGVYDVYPGEPRTYGATLRVKF